MSLKVVPDTDKGLIMGSKTYINYCGDKNSGKTTTIAFLIDKLRKTNGFEKYNCEKEGKQTVNPIEYMFTIEITPKNTKRIVALSTYGDNIETLKDNHEFFDKYSPDIMVTASHCHNDYDHNSFIDNYVSDKNDALKQLAINREVFNYIKVSSIKLNANDSSIEKKNDFYAEYLYNLIMDSLKMLDLQEEILPSKTANQS